MKYRMKLTIMNENNDWKEMDIVIYRKNIPLIELLEDIVKNISIFP